MRIGQLAFIGSKRERQIGDGNSFIESRFVMRKHFMLVGFLGVAFFSGLLAGQPTTRPGQPATRPGHPEPPSAAARLAAAERVCKLLHDPVTGEPTRAYKSVEYTYLWSLRRMEAQRDVDAARGDRFSALEAHAQRMHEFADSVAKQFKAGGVTEFELGSTQYYVAEADEMLARERAK